VECFCEHGIVSQAIKKGALEVVAINPRDYAEKGKVDDYAYGGHPGMVLKPEPIFLAYEDLVSKYGKPYVIIPQPWGKVIDQRDLDRLSKLDSLLVICGRYEGIDERVSTLADEELSLGDFVLSGAPPPWLGTLGGYRKALAGCSQRSAEHRKGLLQKVAGLSRVYQTGGIQRHEGARSFALRQP
jgi:tRNA (Guanine37-N(1)-) methyltransferase (EC 2.1.1.31)